MHGVMLPPRRSTFTVRAHTITVERLEKMRWTVTVDGRRFASFCSESRARAGGRIEARRLDFLAVEEGRVK